MMFARLSGLVFGVLVLCIDVSRGAPVQTSGDVRLACLGQEIGIGATLRWIDPASGQQTSTTFVTSAPGFAFAGLSWDGQRLMCVNNNPIMDVTTRIHPADGGHVTIGPTGLNVVIQSLERNPLTGVVYFTNATSLYTLSPATGAVTLIAAFSGLVHPQDGIYAMAIDSAGNAIGVGGELFHQDNTVYSIDLATANLNAIGEIDGIGGGYFRDIAIADDGMIWGSFYDVGLNPAARGLYKIDPTNGYLPISIQQMNPPPWGLAFVSANQQAEYCSAKLNSLGCSPTISGNGFPSPTASSGYVVRASYVRSQVAGALVFGVNGRTAVPFGGGTLCVAQPWRRTPIQSAGGLPSSAPDCSGTWSLDFNTWMTTMPGLPAGTVVQCQWLGRDPGFTPPGNWTLTDALEFTLRP